MNKLDPIATYNRERWNAIVAAGSQYTRPFLDLTPETAQAWIDNVTTLAKAKVTDVKGKDVLCLAGSGGQQTAVFGLAGANVTVLDLSDAQLAGDKPGSFLDSNYGARHGRSRFADRQPELRVQPGLFVC